MSVPPIALVSVPRLSRVLLLLSVPPAALVSVPSFLKKELFVSVPLLVSVAPDRLYR